MYQDHSLGLKELPHFALPHFYLIRTLLNLARNLNVLWLRGARLSSKYQDNPDK